MTPSQFASLSPDELAKATAEAEAQLIAYRWRSGDLAYKLDSTQIAIRAAREAAWKAPEKPTPGVFLSVEERIRLANVPISFFECCARGNGKSFELLVLALETCIRKANARVLYVAPRREDAEKIARDLIDLFILNDCPLELKPEWKAGDGEFLFKNGSILRFRGTNAESAERLRGFGYDLVILDECAVMDELPSVLGIVEPIAERMGGHVILATTPPETPDHPSKEIFDTHVERGASIVFTINDNVRLTWDEKARILINSGESPGDVPAILAGTARAKKTKTRRERYCEWVAEGASMVHPAWTDLESELTVPANRPRPAFFHAFEALDVGFIDRTGWLAGYVDFDEAAIIIEDEFLLSRASTQDIADAIEAHERALWSPTRTAGGMKQPYRRVSDVDHRLIQDLRSQHDLEFRAIEKKNFDSDINLVNVLISGKQLLVSERCIHLRKQLREGIFSKSGRDMARDSLSGHFDLLAALRYGCRIANLRLNPFPIGFKHRPKGADDVLDVPPLLKASLLPDTPLGRRLNGLVRRFGTAPTRR